MLINCPECNHEISDKALFCPSCGYPMQPAATSRIRNRKPTKAPNGEGAIIHMKGKRRKPWRVRKIKNKYYDAETGKTKIEYFNIGCFATRQEAVLALANFKENPYDLDANKVTFSEVYEKWSTEHFDGISLSMVRQYSAAYNYCQSLYQMRMQDIKVAHIEGVITDCPAGVPTKKNIKMLLNQVFKYALAHEICEKDYSSLAFQTANLFKGSNEEDTERPEKTFSRDEIHKLWECLRMPLVDMVLIQIYSGWRPGELTQLKLADVNLENQTVTGGIKTAAGKNRLVPIHPKIKPLIENRIQKAQEIQSEHLFTYTRTGKTKPYNGRTYAYYFQSLMEELQMSHKPHDCRHTFITLAKASYMDDHVLKRIVGHCESDLTERVYTHRTLEQLHEEMCKIQIE